MWVPVLVLVLTVAQLAVAEYVPGIERFADKAFTARRVEVQISGVAAALLRIGNLLCEARVVGERPAAVDSDSREAGGE